MMNGVRVPIRSTSAPAGAFATSRVKRFALRIMPTRNGEMPKTVPKFGRMGKITPPPKPTKNVHAITVKMTVSERFSGIQALNAPSGMLFLRIMDYSTSSLEHTA